MFRIFGKFTSVADVLAGSDPYDDMVASWSRPFVLMDASLSIMDASLSIMDASLAHVGAALAFTNTSVAF